MWYRSQQSKKRLSGHEYKTRLGKSVRAKTFSDKLCNCARGCNAKISSEDSEASFRSFYSHGDQSKQNLFLHDCIKSSSVKRRRPTNDSKAPRNLG